MKYFQKELIKSVKQADAATRAKSLFLASISHEIRTPMNSIIGLSELAIQNRKPEKISDYLSKINNFISAKPYPTGIKISLSISPLGVKALGI